MSKPELSLSKVEGIMDSEDAESVPGMSGFVDKRNIKVSFEYNWATNWMHTETSHDDIYRDDQFRPDESFEKLYLLVRAWAVKGTNDDMKVEHVYDWEVRELSLQNY